MKPSLLPMTLGALLVLGACQKSPEDQRAADLRDAARVQARAVTDQAQAEAGALDKQAKDLDGQGKAAGGFTGERLETRSDALAREADIVKRQGAARARAIEDAAKAQAEAIHSR
jgi:hypothetical protein